MSEQDRVPGFLSSEELDTIGEIMNISMGSAATVVSTMLEKQVTITTPILEQNQFKNIDSTGLEPALIVRIRYTEGIEGTNVIMFRRHDMQIILDLLMGNETPGSEEDFEFDDMSMSAACEVMNQMMGASSTALSEILEMPINISTPEATLVQTKEEIVNTFFDLEGTDQIVAISFKMMIKDVLNTTFTCFLSTELASKIVRHVSTPAEEPSVEAPATAPEAAMPQMAPPPVAAAQMAPPPVAAAQMAPPPVAAAQMAPPPQAAAQMPPPQAAAQMPPPQAAAQTPPPQAAAQTPPPYTPPTPSPIPDQSTPRMPMQFAAAPPAPMQQPYYDPSGYPPYGQQMAPPQYGMQPQYNMPYGQPPMAYPPQQMTGYTPAPVQVKNAEFPDFSKQSPQAMAPSISNMGLLMGVQLEVSVVIGHAKRKIKDILDFGQGAVVELDKQTGSPAEIVVNGQLLAYGDIIVVGDNFGVRITEIVGTKELLDSLNPNS